MSVNFDNTTKSLNIKKYEVIGTQIRNTCENIFSENADVFNNLFGNNPEEKDSMVNYSGDFSEFTDYQNASFAAFTHLSDYEIDLGENGKTINQLCKEHKDDSTLSRLQRYGFGRIKVLEIINDSNGFDAIVLQDTNGDYLIFYPGTDSEEQNDIYYDAKNIADYYIDSLKPNELSEIFPEAVNYPALKNSYYNLIGDSIDKAYSSQQKSAESLTDKYFKLAMEKGKNLNFGGYSLGGSLAEYSYLYKRNSIYNEIPAGYGSPQVLHGEAVSPYGASIYSELETYNLPENLKKEYAVLGGLKLYNPYHDRLDQKEVQYLKEADSFELYCAQGDLVSAVFNYEDFDDVANYIYVDYETAIEEFKEEKNSEFIVNFSVSTQEKPGQATVQVVLTPVIAGLAQVGFNISPSDLYDIFKVYLYSEHVIGGAHKISPVERYRNNNFNEDGSLREKIIIDGIEHERCGVPFSTISETLVGYDVKEEFKDKLADINESAGGTIAIHGVSIGTILYQFGQEISK